MKTLAIVSSYSESCGNATFTNVLRNTIEEYCHDYSVEVVELNLTLLQSTDQKIRRLAASHIEELTTSLKGFDLVNIQFEAGLYGTLPTDILKRFKTLLKANKNVSVTLHSPRLISSTPANSRGWIKELLKFNIKGAIKEFLETLQPKITYSLNDKVIKLCKKFNAKLIVHTKRSFNQITTKYKYESISIHPLFFVESTFSTNNDALLEIKRNLGFSDSDIIVGIFGYISSYKGHLDAFSAIKLLPSNYKLLVFGRQHPQSIKSSGKIDQFISKLQKTIVDKKLLNKVYFMGELSDSEFMSVLQYIDITWMPYYENGQDGSGIASLTLELSKRVLCSHSFAFDELFKLVRFYNYKRFDIGNYIELASKTTQMINDSRYNDKVSFQSQYSIQTQAKLYVDIFN